MRLWASGSILGRRPSALARISSSSQAMVNLEFNTKVAIIRLFLFTASVLIGAAIFQALEGPHQHQEILKYRKVRKQIVRKYNISDDDAKLWAGTYQPNTPPGSQDFLEWNYGNAFVFTMVVVTTIGNVI